MPPKIQQTFKDFLSKKENVAKESLVIAKREREESSFAARSRDT